MIFDYESCIGDVMLLLSAKECRHDRLSSRPRHRNFLFKGLSRKLLWAFWYIIFYIRKAYIIIINHSLITSERRGWNTWNDQCIFCNSTEKYRTQRKRCGSGRSSFLQLMVWQGNDKDVKTLCDVSTLPSACLPSQVCFVALSCHGTPVSWPASSPSHAMSRPTFSPVGHWMTSS